MCMWYSHVSFLLFEKIKISPIYALSRQLVHTLTITQFLNILKKINGKIKIYCIYYGIYFDILNMYVLWNCYVKLINIIWISLNLICGRILHISYLSNFQLYNTLLLVMATMSYNSRSFEFILLSYFLKKILVHFYISFQFSKDNQLTNALKSMGLEKNGSTQSNKI